MRHLAIPLVAIFCCYAIAGCGDADKGPMQKTGEAIDKAAEKTGEAVEKTVDKVKDAAK